MRKRAKTDENQTEVVNALRSMGATAQSLAAIGDGCPDILCGYRGRTILMELKREALRKRTKVLTDDQNRWANSWKGGPLWVVYNAEQAVEILRKIDE